MYETPEDIQQLQDLLDHSIERAGTFLRQSFQMPDHSLSARQLIHLWQRMQTIAFATVTRNGEILILTTTTFTHPGRRVPPGSENERKGDCSMNSEQEKARLLHLHENVLQAHFEKDAKKFLAAYASQWYDVRNTGVRLRTKEEAFPTIEQYFKRTHFSDISEIVAPIIHISTDASMAWVIGEIRVRASQEVSDEKERDFSFRCTWVSIYEKHDDEWEQVVDASSFQFQTNDD